MDDELKQLDLAIADERALATEALDALRAPQEALRAAAAEYIGSVAKERIDATRRVSVEVMARLSDDEVAELRFWVEEQLERVRAAVERDIESCDFWIRGSSGMSPTDVNTYGAALVPRPRDTASGIPQALVLLFEDHLEPLRQGLAAVGMHPAATEAARTVELALVRAWRTYREAAVVCLAKWADVDERYRASAERFQEMRWERAGETDPETIKARRDAPTPDETESSASVPTPVSTEADSLVPTAG